MKFYNYIPAINWIVLFLLLASIFGLFEIKYKVQSLTQDIHSVNQQIQKEKNEINLLKTEWAYLNTPERLSKIAREYLNMKPISVAQLGLHDNNHDAFAARDRFVIDAFINQADSSVLTRITHEDANQ